MEKQASNQAADQAAELTEKNVEVFLKATSTPVLKKALEVSMAFTQINKQMSGQPWWDHAEALCKDYNIDLILIQQQTIKRDGRYVNGLANKNSIKCISMENTSGIFAFFHELGHVLLHLQGNGKIIIWQSEIQADLFAYCCAATIWPQYQKSFRELFYINPVTEDYLGYMKTIF